MKLRITAVTILVLTATTGVLGDPPEGYYNSVDANGSTTLRLTLHAVIDDHQRFPYTSGSTDAFTVPVFRWKDRRRSLLVSSSLILSHRRGIRC